MSAEQDAVVAAAEPAPKRGRRLSADRSDVILGTVLELLHEVGYDQLRMQDVADRAGVGLSTIYRRWPTKQDVVLAASTAPTSTTGFPRPATPAPTSGPSSSTWPRT